MIARLELHIRLLAAVAATVLLWGGGDLLVGPAHATAIGSVNVNDDGLLLEPLAPLGPRRQVNDTSVDLRQFMSLGDGETRRRSELEIDLFDASVRANAASALYPSELNAANLRNALESFTSLTWMRGRTGPAIGFENDQWSDFRAIAIASYSPEIRYWLGGDRWANFGAASPGQQARTGLKGQGNFQTPGTGHNTGSQVFRDDFGNSAPKSNTAAPITLQDFAISLFSKIIKQPIVYMILLGGIGVFVWSTMRRSAAR